MLLAIKAFIRGGSNVVDFNKFKGTVCNDLSNLLTQISVFVHK